MLLTLDLGATTGWCLGQASKREINSSGIFRLKGELGPRLLQLSHHLDTLPIAQITNIGYEIVHRHIGTHAAHAYGAYQGLIHMWGTYHAKPITKIEISHAKRALTGNSRADKDQMLEAAKRLWQIDAQTHDQADAVGIYLAMQEMS